MEQIDCNIAQDGPTPEHVSHFLLFLAEGYRSRLIKRYLLRLSLKYDRDVLVPRSTFQQ
jgi:hypothetical protein